jgi:HPt (histidine-containing phosphotransfer) domain-containing protein
MESSLIILDIEILEQLQLLSADEPEFFRELIASFISQAAVFEAELLASISRNDLAEQKRILHKLLGSSSSLGAAALALTLEKLHRKLTQNQFLTGEDLEELAGILNKTREALQKYLKF